MKRTKKNQGKKPLTLFVVTVKEQDGIALVQKADSEKEKNSVVASRKQEETTTNVIVALSKYDLKTRVVPLIEGQNLAIEYA